jgi:hypothetical protein
MPSVKCLSGGVVTELLRQFDEESCMAAYW